MAFIFLSAKRLRRNVQSIVIVFSFSHPSFLANIKARPKYLRSTRNRFSMKSGSFVNRRQKRRVSRTSKISKQSRFGLSAFLSGLLVDQFHFLIKSFLTTVVRNPINSYNNNTNMKIFSSFALVALVALAVPRALAVPEGGEELPVHKKTLKEIVYEKSHAVGKPKFPRGPRSRGLKQRGASSTDTAHRALGKSGGKGGFDSCCELLESLSKIEAKCYDVIREYSVYEISAEYLGCEEDLNIRKGSEDPALYLEEKYYKYQEEFYDEIYSLFDGDEEDFSEKLSCLSQLANLVYSDIDTSFGLELYCIDDYENCECECYCNPGNCLVVAEPVQIEQEPLMMVEDNCDEVCECM